MILLFLTLRDKEVRVVNLNRVELVEFEKDSFDFWIGQKLSRITLKDGSRDEAFARFSRAMRPIYDGRLSPPLGTRVDLDLSDLQPNKVPF